MPVAVSIPVTIPCVLCGGRPYFVRVPLRTEPDGAWLRVAVDDESLAAAVRAHLRQHEN